MSHTSTHTHATLPVSQPVFDEIKEKLLKAGYGEQIDHLPEMLIDMNGLALVVDAFVPEEVLNSGRFGHWFLEFCADQAAWSQKTFGSDSTRGPIGPLKHMLKEVQEALDNPTDIEEYADLLLLLMDSSRRAGFSPMSLLYAARAKMRKNKEREWPKPTSDEPVEHVRFITKDEAQKMLTPTDPKETLAGTIGDGKGELISHIDVDFNSPYTDPNKAPDIIILGRTEYRKTRLAYPNPIWMAKLMEEIQEWLNNIYADTSSVPICCWSSTTTTDAISIGSEVIWDSESDYGRDGCGEELSLEGITEAYTYYLEDLAMPLLKDRL